MGHSFFLRLLFENSGVNADGFVLIMKDDLKASDEDMAFDHDLSTSNNFSFLKNPDWA